MGYTEADAQADAHATDLAEEEAIAQDARLQALEAEQKARDRAQKERDLREFQEKFERIFPGLHPNERIPFSAWLLAQGRKFSDKKLSRSDARFMVLKAVAYCPDFKIDLHRDNLDVYDLIDLIVPEKDEPGWGRVGRPRTLRHRIYRMVPDDLLAADGEGRMTEALSLTAFGAFYLHQSGHFSGVDLLAYWRWINGHVDPQAGRPAPVWDNPRYLEFVETGVVDRGQEFKHSTPGATRWESLRHLHDDGWQYHTTGRLEEYDLKLRDLTKAIENIHESVVDECFKVLEDYDRHALMADVLTQSDIGNSVLREETIDRLDRGSYEARFTKLTGYYQAAHPDEDGENVVADLIVRSAWVVVRQVMDHRMNDDYSTNTIKRAEQGDPIAQLDLDEYRMIQGWVDPDDYVEIDEDYYEPDEDIARGR